MHTSRVIPAIIRATTITITTTIMGLKIDVKLTIWDNYLTSFDFTILGSPYTFVITKWSGRGFAKFGTLFFNASERDTQQFGTFGQSSDGTVHFSMDAEQKLNMIKQGVKDILTCIDKICCHYQQSVLDYAVWYNEKHPEMDSYEQYITRVTCRAIAQVEFLAPNVNWDVVRFNV
jgi:hypothetical protein